MSPTLHASLEHGEAVLRFPYDDSLRRLLRAIPGRRWHPSERAWTVPLDSESAEALTRLFAGLRRPPLVSDALARVLERRRGRRDPRECVLDVARPDESWWLTFATDCAPGIAAALLKHPDAYQLPEIGRALIPLDERAARLMAELPDGAERLRVSNDATHALTEVAQRAAEPANTMSSEVELRRDRRGDPWILICARHAPLARVLAARASLHSLEGPSGTFAVAAVERDAAAIAQLIDDIEPTQVDPRAQRWLALATAWRGTVDVGGSPSKPLFLLIGEPERLPAELRETAASVPGGASLPLMLQSWCAIEPLRAFTSPAAQRCIAALKEGRPAPPAVLALSPIHEQPTFVLEPGHDDTQLDAFGSLPGVTPRMPPDRRARADARGREHTRLPALRADPFCVAELDPFLAEREIWIEPDALVVLQEIREQHARAAGLVALSAATDAPLALPSLGGELKPFQRAGVRYLLSQRRAFLADEQGLGKTIEALATLEADDAYPAVVVCPASLKLNWMRELEQWLPHRRAQTLSGRTGEQPPAAADVTVVNYDILAARERVLAAFAPRALVLDESHYCKNAAAKRTQAVARLAARVPGDGLVLALTGTPVMNRPPELISQLRILGRLADFGSGAQFGRRFRGPDAHVRLHWHLRSRCFVRRLKSEVLPQLPAKTRSIVPVALDNEGEYRLAEHDVIAWLRSRPLDLRELDAKVAAALRAERLVRLNALKLLAARGKLHAALAWIHDFLSSGERLVVFANHREVQHALVDRFPHALHVLGSDSHLARDGAVRRFQESDDEDAQLIVCSLAVAGQGLTLTKASNVAFLELDWTPAKHDQAEDRCHRIGQPDAVNAWYLLAAGTIDETIATLLERKRAVIGAVTDGRPEHDEAVIDALARELAGEPYRHLRAVA